MMNVSIFDRIKLIANVITSESFFITLFIIMILTIIALIINMKVKSKAPKYCIAIVYTGLAILVLARYGGYILSFNDSVVEKVFKALYFPNVVVYLSMLVITLLMLAITIIDDKFSLFTKISNFLCFFFIWFLFILIVASVKREGLNFYEVTQVYSNEEIMVLLQASMFAFVIWLGILIMDLVVRKLSNSLDKKTSKESSKPAIKDDINPIIKDDINPIIKDDINPIIKDDSKNTVNKTIDIVNMVDRKKDKSKNYIDDLLKNSDNEEKTNQNNEQNNHNDEQNIQNNEENNQRFQSDFYTNSQYNEQTTEQNKEENNQRFQSEFFTNSQYNEY